MILYGYWDRPHHFCDSSGLFLTTRLSYFEISKKPVWTQLVDVVMYTLKQRAFCLVLGSCLCIVLTLVDKLLNYVNNAGLSQLSQFLSQLKKEVSRKTRSWKTSRKRFPSWWRRKVKIVANKQATHGGCAS